MAEGLSPIGPDDTKMTGDFEDAHNPKFQAELRFEQLDKNELTDNCSEKITSEEFDQEREDAILKEKISQIFEGKDMPVHASVPMTPEKYAKEFMMARIGIANILSKLKERIDTGDITSLIGDDASGRVPGYILFRALGAIYMADGRKPLKITFLAGGKDVDELVWEQISEAVGKLKDDFGECPLMITDRISGAYTIFQYVRAFKDNGIDLTISAMQSWDDKIPERYNGERSGDIDEDIAGKEIISGLNKEVYESGDLPEGYQHETNAFYHMTELSGREKHLDGTVWRGSRKHGIIKGFTDKKVFNNYGEVDLVKEGLEASRLVADVIAREYLSKNPKGVDAGVA